MHDPMTLAIEIKAPWTKPLGDSGRRYRPSLIDIWHVDPETDHTDDSCDWFGHKRPLNEYERALREAIWRAESTFGNPPYYPDTPAWTAFDAIQQASYEWRRRRGFRWHPRWHVHHWRIRVPAIHATWRWLTQRCSICGNRIRPSDTVISNWGGDSPRHYACDRPQWGGETRMA